MSDWYPVTGFYFSVKFIGGLATVASATDSSFKEVSGIEMKVETDTIYEGGLNNFSWKVPKSVSLFKPCFKKGCFI